MPQRRSERLLRARAMMQRACQAPCESAATLDLRVRYLWLCAPGGLQRAEGV